MAQTAGHRGDVVETGGSAGVRTFLIADVRGYTRFTLQHGDASAARLAARFAEIARDVVGSRDGKVIELRGDEALAVFNSTRQALWAAVELQECLTREMAANPSLPLRVGIGLDAGEAIPVGEGYRGAALNLAARLCSLAGPGEVLASETVASLARKVDGLAYVDRGAANLKGFAQPVSIVGITLETPQGSDSTGPEVHTVTEIERIEQQLSIGSYLGALPGNPLVGRKTELQRALRVVDSVLAGNGKLLLLAGEPGAGKTRLAQEITLNVRNRDWIIAAGRCYEAQQSVPLYPFVEALTALYTAASAHTKSRVPHQWPDIGRLLPSLGFSLPDSPGPHDQQRLFWAVTGFIEAVAAEHPIALLLDDLHCADNSSLEMLQHLARHIHGDRVLLLGTFRDVDVNRQHPLEAALRDLNREGLIERIDVRRMTREDTMALIADVMDEDAVSSEFAELVYRRTEGNAFFIQQVLRVLIERGDVFRSDGVWDRKGIDEIEVPESVRSVVGQRLSRLHEETQEILRDASVLGQTFAFDELQVMSGRDERTLEVRLDEAIAAGMVRETGRDGYGFDHALTQGTLYAELTGRRRRRLHLAAGEAIEQLPESKRAGRTAELAWHFLEGDDSQRALHWSLRAGDADEMVSAHSDAEYQYRTALQLAREEGDEAGAAEASEKLGRVLFTMARPVDAQKAFEEAIRLHRKLSSVEGEIRVTADLGFVLYDQTQSEEGLTRLQPMLERWERDPVPSPAATSLHIALADLYWQGGRSREGLPIVRQAIRLAAALGDTRLAGVAEARHVKILQDLGDAAEATEALSRSIEMSEAAGDRETLTNSLNNRALNAAKDAQWDRVRPDQERHLDIARQLGNPSQIVWALGQLMYMALNADGDIVRAQSYAREIVVQSRRMAGTRSGWFLGMARWTLLIAGDNVSEGLDYLRSACEQSANVPLWMSGQFHLALWDELQSHGEQARERLTALLEFPRVENQYRSEAVLVLARIHLMCGDIDHAEHLAALCLSEAHVSTWPFARPDALLAVALVRGAQSRWEDAEELFGEAVTQLPSGGFKVAFTFYRYGLALAQNGNSILAKERLSHALELFEQMDLKPFITLAGQALADL